MYNYFYRAPSGNFDLFLSKLNVVLRNLYTATLEYIVCGDINIDYLIDSDRKSRLDALLKSYKLTSVVNFQLDSKKNLLQLLTTSLLTLPKWVIVLYPQ